MLPLLPLQPLRRPVTPPPARPPSPEAEGQGNTGKTPQAPITPLGQQPDISSNTSPGVDAVSAVNASEGGAVGGVGVGVEADSFKRHPTIIQTIPMQLVPLTPSSEMRDALTKIPLVAPPPSTIDSSSSNTGSSSPGDANVSSRSRAQAAESGFALPRVGPWLLTNSILTFPTAEAEFASPPLPQQQQHENPAVPRLLLRFEHVQQRSSLAEEQVCGACCFKITTPNLAKKL